MAIERSGADSGIRPRPPRDRAKVFPVAYIPGFFSPSLYSWYLGWRFESLGFDFHQVKFPRLASGDMIEMAAQLKGYVEGLVESTSSPRIILVCHSAGGLIARYYIQKMDRNAPLSCVVFMGTPHRGTYSALAGICLKTCRQMFPGSRFMQELDGNLGRLLTGRSISLYSRRDYLVLPVESGRLAGARNREVEGPFGHGIIFNPRAFKIATSFIGEMVRR